MKLKNEVLSRINTPAMRVRLALALECTEQSIIRMIKKNSDDLTKASALRVIREELDLEDSQILEDAVSTAA